MRCPREVEEKLYRKARELGLRPGDCYVKCWRLKEDLYAGYMKCGRKIVRTIAKI